MIIHTHTVFDIKTGRILEDHGFDYEGPLALCDRSLARQGQAGATTAAQTAGMYGSQAQQTAGALMPTLESFTLNPPGYSPFALGAMETKAQETTAAARAKAEQEAQLRAVRTRNVAGLGAQAGAIAGETARAGGETLQGILAANEALKERQREQGISGLEGIYGRQVGAQLESQGQVPQNIEAALQAKKSGWLQNITGILGSLPGLKIPGLR